MKTKGFVKITPLIVILSTVVQKGAAQTQPPEYVAVKINALTNYTSQFPWALNNKGQIAGGVTWSNGDWPFLYSSGSVYLIDAGSHDIADAAQDINDSGQMVGSVTFFGEGYYRQEAFIHSDGLTHILGNLGGSWTAAYGINNLGQVVGAANITNSISHAFLYSGGIMNDLGTLGEDSSGATAINDSGQIIGTLSMTNNHEYSAFLYSDGAMSYMGTMDGDKVNPRDINNAGQVVGWSDSSPVAKAFLYDEGVFTNLGSLNGQDTRAVAINNNGWIVGNSGGQPFLYVDGVMYDLETLLVPQDGTQIGEVFDINDHGQIVATTYVPTNSQWVVYVLNPLSQGWHDTIETEQPEPTYGLCALREPDKDSLIVLTHGWTPKHLNLLSPPDPSWLDAMSNVLSSHLSGQALTNWQVSPYRWVSNSWTWFPGNALEMARQEGDSLGQQLLTQSWSHVHFISHSAGAGLIQAATEVIKSNAPSTTVHCTFLDAYLGPKHAGLTEYGKMADWADNYFSVDSETVDTLTHYTSGACSNAYNVDVTYLDPNKYPVGSYRSSLGGDVEECFKTISSHGWPREFYLMTAFQSWPGAQGFGFTLSEEGGNWNYATNQYQVGNSPPLLLGTPDAPCEPDVRFEYEAPAWVDFLQSTTIDSDSGTVQKGANSLLLVPGSPVWSATIVVPTNPVNSVTFEAMFQSTNNSDSLLSVYWDSDVIGSVAERTTGETKREYVFTFPSAAMETAHILGFRLDPYTNAPASVVITNVTLSRVGVTEPFSLSATTNFHNGLPVLELTGQSGFTYTVEASTNLIDWEKTALLVNTNGVVPFVDSTSTSHRHRFYRAVVQQ